MEPSKVLDDACRRLEGHPGTRVIEGLAWDERDELWVLHVEITADSADEALVPVATRWFLALSPRYPFGDIVVYPAKILGLSRTFPHQSYNGPGPTDRPWRSGNVCVREPAFDRRSGTDPLGDEGRLAWYVDRTRLWLSRASQGTLLQDGDPFELPPFAACSGTIAFDEDESSFASTALGDAPFGVAELVALGSPFPLVVRRFLSGSGKELVCPSWGNAIRDRELHASAAWVRLPSLPLVPPYGTPQSYGELFQVMREHGLDPENVFAAAIAPLRGKRAPILLVGFPVPERVGESNSRVHWQPLLLPELSTPANSKGFRPRATGLWLRDVARVFRDGDKVSWLKGCNWNEEQLGRRGVLSTGIRGRHVVLIGAGALGSMVAELLARGGVRRFTIIDGDKLSAGNLTRHTVDLTGVDQDKAQALASRLNAISPHVRATAVTQEFPQCLRADPGLMTDADVVIDCSASDDVITALGERTLSESALTFSASIGPGAQRLYLLSASGSAFPSRGFLDESLPLLEADRATGAWDEVWEGTGCWHPVFPARADVLAGFAVAIVQRLAAAVDDGAVVGLEVISRHSLGMAQ